MVIFRSSAPQVPPSEEAESRRIFFTLEAEPVFPTGKSSATPGHRETFGNLPRPSPQDVPRFRSTFFQFWNFWKFGKNPSAFFRKVFSSGTRRKRLRVRGGGALPLRRKPGPPPAGAVWQWGVRAEKATAASFRKERPPFGRFSPKKKHSERFFWIFDYIRFGSVFRWIKKLRADFSNSASRVSDSALRESMQFSFQNAFARRFRRGVKLAVCTRNSKPSVGSDPRFRQRQDSVPASSGPPFGF
ncbi:hypothetical protein NPIL_679851 [Nephila pilipes]|uniref:Uncharacterized protein n=1 Tax=Nephila pilipes TaxID=299642 RepID=A0A8X6PWC9_NEPPI|nr:hypothetical protein NPIL_679851 [Nephila pilipes]